MIVLAGDQSSTTYSNVQANMSRIESYRERRRLVGCQLRRHYVAELPYSYDVLPRAPGVSFVGQSGTNIDVLAPGSGLITGPGGVITNTTLDGGSSSYHGYTTSTLPAGAIAILDTSVPSQVVAFDYLYGSGHVVIDTIPLEYYNAVGNFGHVFHQNLFSFGMGSGGDQDYFAVTGSAGTALTIGTATPGDGSGEFVNTLDPKIELYDPSGTLVASDDNGGPTGGMPCSRTRQRQPAHMSYACWAQVPPRASTC